MEKILAIRGMHDLLPPQSALWNTLEATARRLLHAYGFGEIRTPIVEATELFARGLGEATDIVEKEMYSFADRNGKMLTMRPEGTASVVRALVEAGWLNVPASSGGRGYEGPVHKLYYMGPMFRYERPQKGRQRQFYQIGVEAFGDAGPDIDIEILALGADLLRAIGVFDLVRLELNYLGSLEDRKKYRAELERQFSPRSGELCADCQRRLTLNPLRILDCKVDSCRQVAATLPSMLSFLDDPATVAFARIQQGLKDLQIPFRVNDRIIRGLDYYTGTAFEFVTDALGAQGAVLAGGRYDGLTAELGGPNVPAIGFAAGVERLVLLTEQGKGLTSGSEKRLAVVTLGEKARAFAAPLIRDLRSQGVAVAVEWRDKSMKALLRWADREGVDAALVIGDQELASRVAQWKDMKAGTQTTIALQDPAEIRSEIGRRLRS